MQSEKLFEVGLANYIAGADYDFRYNKVGDRVRDDILRALNEMDIQPTHIYLGHQVHGQKVVDTTMTRGKDFVIGQIYDDTDGLLTNLPGVALLIKFADCTPILLFDPVNKVQAVVHSGWRGTVQRIAEQAINQMVENYGSNHKDILALLGPSIDQENYEVGLEVYEAFADVENRNNFFYPKGDKYHLSMNRSNMNVLLEAGILYENIEICPGSTYSNGALHSARAEGPDYGLNAMISIIL